MELASGSRVVLTAITIAAQRDVVLDDGRAGLALPLPDAPTIAARHVRPGEPIAVVLARDGEPQLDEANWGVAPRHVPDGRAFAKRYRTHRVFLERLAESRVFAPLWKRGQRCAIPLSAYDDFVRGEGVRLVRVPGIVAWAAGVYRAPREPDGSDLEAAFVLGEGGGPLLVAGSDLAAWLDAATEVVAALGLLRECSG